VQIPPADTPIACDVSTAPDTAAERLAEDHRLFTTALIARERTPQGTVRFRFRADDGVAAWVRDLAAREQACCAFFAFEVTTVGDQVHWDAAVADNDTAHALLDEFFRLPDTTTEDPAVLAERYRDHGLEFVNGEPV
jgi:hypothetical protein